MAYGAIIGQSGVIGEYLPLTGGTINGNIDMNGNQIINVQKITRTGVGYLNLESDSNINLNPGSGIISVNNARIQGLTLPNLGTDAANKGYVDSKNILVNDKPITETSTYQYWLSTSPSNKTTITIPKGGMYSFRMSSGMGDARVNIDKINGENPLFTVIVRGEIDYHISTTAWADSVSPSLVGSQYVIIDS